MKKILFFILLNSLVIPVISYAGALTRQLDTNLSQAVKQYQYKPNTSIMPLSTRGHGQGKGGWDNEDLYPLLQYSYLTGLGPGLGTSLFIMCLAYAHDSYVPKNNSSPNPENDRNDSAWLDKWRPVFIATHIAGTMTTIAASFAIYYFGPKAYHALKIYWSSKS